MHSIELRESDDPTLVERARGGDVEAFGELVRRHHPAAMRLATAIAGPEADDIVQDALVRLHGGLHSYRGSGSVRSWLLRAVANQAKNELRGRDRRRDREDRHARRDRQVSTTPDAAAIESWEHEQLAAALSSLSARDRAVLGCRFVTGLSEAETAEVLDVAIGTVKSRTARALRRLHADVARRTGEADR